MDLAPALSPHSPIPKLFYFLLTSKQAVWFSCPPESRQEEVFLNASSFPFAFTVVCQNNHCNCLFKGIKKVEKELHMS